MWWASLSLRVATYAALAVGLVVSLLTRLRDTETYGHAELSRREEQLRVSLRRTKQLLSFAGDLARAVTPAEVAEALCMDAAAASGLPRASLLVARPGQGLVLLGSVGYDSRMRAEVNHIGWDTPHPGPRSLVEGRAVFLSKAEEIRAQFPAVTRTPMREAATVAALPIRVGSEPLGVLILWDSRPRVLGPLERDVLVGLAAQGGQALKRAQAFENEADAAATLQRSLLPSGLPRRDGLAMAARYLAGERGLRVGGDWYDCVEIDDRFVVLVVGDVMGKGLRAAALMGQLRTAVRSLAAVDPSPAAVLNGLDRLTKLLDTDEIATVAYILLDVETSTARIARAGHLPPILVDPEGHASLLSAGGSPPLGSPVTERIEAQVEVPASSLLVLYTDGIVESPATALEGLDDFVAKVAHAAVRHRDNTESLAAELLAVGTAANRGEDDIALLVARSISNGAKVTAPHEWLRGHSSVTLASSRTCAGDVPRPRRPMRLRVRISAQVHRSDLGRHRSDSLIDHLRGHGGGASRVRRRGVALDQHTADDQCAGSSPGRGSAPAKTTSGPPGRWSGQGQGAGRWQGLLSGDANRFTFSGSLARSGTGRTYLSSPAATGPPRRTRNPVTLVNSVRSPSPSSTAATGSRSASPDTSVASARIVPRLPSRSLTTKNTTPSTGLKWCAANTCPNNGCLSDHHPHLARQHGTNQLQSVGITPSTGKTHLGTGIAVRACRAGHRVLFATAARWVDRLAEHHAAGRLQDELRRLARYPLLVIDLCRARDHAEAFITEFVAA